MEERKLKCKGAAGRDITLHMFATGEENVKGAVLILHGMAEHFERYEGFFKGLNDAGFDAYAYDHRGHGINTPDEDLGFFGKKKGYELVIEDAVAALKYVKENKRGGKCFLFGHSMGSLIARNVIQRYDDIDGALICGTGYMPAAVCSSGLALANIVTCLTGPRHRSKFLNNVMFNNKEYNRDRKRTPFDWLTKDEKIVDEYIKDKYCGFLCTASFYRDLIWITGHAASGIGATRRDLPIFIASGTEDPVGSFGKGVEALYEKLKELGFTNVKCKLYKGDRHELLNEFDKEQVIRDFAGFFSEV
ncbi:MAG: lysophospholipase [Lachnospiraceae bacterium]|nr:lysophospholipase [Lachnospiraceae bacterium]